MDVERIIDDIEQVQEMFEAPDIRPLSEREILGGRLSLRMSLQVVLAQPLLRPASEESLIFRYR